MAQVVNSLETRTREIDEKLKGRNIQLKLMDQQLLNEKVKNKRLEKELKRALEFIQENDRVRESIGSQQTDGQFNALVEECQQYLSVKSLNDSSSNMKNQVIPIVLQSIKQS